MMKSNCSGLVNGFEYSDVGFGVPSSSDFDILTNWVPRTQDHYSPSLPPPHDDIDSENTLLKYVNQLLMEESIAEEEEHSIFHDSLALKRTEEMLQQVITESSSSVTQSSSCNLTPPSSSDSSVMSFQSSTIGFGQQANEDLVRSMFSDADSALQFKKGLEEASKFLPNTNQWIFSQDHEEKGMVSFKEEERFSSLLRIRKNHHERDEEDRSSSKQLALNLEEGKVTELFDKVLLLDGESDPLIIDSNGSSNAPPQVKAKREGSRTKKKSQTVDFRTLLTLCARSVSSGDKITADDLLRKIRKQSSPLGDASQRLAHFFANALEARLEGSKGNMIQSYYDSISSKRRAASQTLKSYKVFLSSSPFMTLMYFFSNKMILDAAKDGSVLHIIDFGILYGFQWPMFIQHLSKTGPRKLRITGVEIPQRGFRPTERIEDTGRRLTEYCKRFGVPFEYNAIASKNWETIRLRDFNIRPNEILAVNTVLRFKNLRDATPGEEDCPRDGFLRLIRDMKPNVFLSSTVNGSFNTPFFTTRFKEALFHYSALFDMFGTTLARENQERIHFEGEFYGREVMNVIACEGVDRVERPETYKQWQVRMVRAGFKQKAVEAGLVESFRVKMKKWGYHKDFVLDEDSNWFLQGWKGRILFSSSCWVPS